MSHANKYHVFVIKEGIDSTSGGLGTWFHSMAVKFEIEGKSVTVFSLKANNRTEFQNSNIVFAYPPTPFRWSAKVLRLEIVRQVFAKFAWDAEFFVDKLFGISANWFLQLKFRSVRGETIISTPLYAGFGSYLSEKMNVEIGLVSSTEDGLVGMKLTEQKFMRQYLPKIKKERLSLEKHKRRVAVSRAIFERYALDERNSFYRIDTPRVFDELNNSMSNLTSNKVIDYKNRKDILLFIGRCENRKGFDYL